MSEIVKLGIIGCGMMGGSLAKAAKSTGLARVMMVFDADEKRRSLLARDLETDAASSEEELLASDDIEAVMVALPPFLHCDVVKRIAQAGKHIFIEKPMALSVADCDEMLAAIQESGTTMMVGHVLRYCEPFRTILRLSKEGRFGRPIHGSIWRLGSGDYIELSPWRAKRELSGGYLHEVGSHELDFLCCLLGEPATIYAVVQKQLPSEHEIEDVVSVLAQFDSGIQGTYLGGTGFPRDAYGYCLRFEDCTVRSDSARELGRMVIESVSGTISKEDMMFSVTNPIKEEAGDWLGSIIDGAPVPIPGEEGRRTIAIVEAAYNAALCGSAVRLSWT